MEEKENMAGYGYVKALVPQAIMSDAIMSDPEWNDASALFCTNSYIYVYLYCMNYIEKKLNSTSPYESDTNHEGVFPKGVK